MRTVIVILNSDVLSISDSRLMIDDPPFRFNTGIQKHDAIVGGSADENKK
jgi:hypothetical protein